VARVIDRAGANRIARVGLIDRSHLGLTSLLRCVGPKPASYWAIQRATRLGSRLDRRR